MAYGSDGPELFRRAATFVDKIFRGEKPADIPVEQPTKFNLVIDLRRHAIAAACRRPASPAP